MPLCSIFHIRTENFTLMVNKSPESPTLSNPINQKADEVEEASIGYQILSKGTS